DGIRDKLVTGVQTCALPISAANSEQSNRDLKGTLSFVAGSPSGGFGSTSDMNTGFAVEKSIFSSGTMAVQGNVGYGSGSPTAVRSEERRVGKEGRCGGCGEG